MQSIWEFTKRHKGKIIAGGSFIGTIVFAHSKMISYYRSLEKDDLKLEWPNQARRHYIFDSTHRSCDQSITDLIPSIVTQIETRFNVDSIKELLVSDSNLTVEQKLQYWSLLKVNVFCRIVSVAYGFTILTLTLKAQISILASDTCKQFENQCLDKNWYQTFFEQFSVFLNRSNTQKNKIKENNSYTEIGNRRVFLQCVQFFTLKGLPQLMESVFDTVSKELKHWNLNDVKSKKEIHYLFDKIGSKILSNNVLRELVAPLNENWTEKRSPVFELLQKLLSNLERSESFVTLNSLVDFYFSTVLKMVEKEEQQFAKYIPAFSNAYSTLISTSFDSPLFNSLYSSDIYQFSVKVFNSQS